MLEPVQRSLRSQRSALGLHSEVAGCTFAVQLAVAPVVPVQVSCRSQRPLGAPPHAVPGASAASAGQAREEPVHVSATSQPDEFASRHTKVEG